ncbi:MAG: hypothetical protein JXA01_05670 [Dehalococcoidia bacterium]|nr:hypothetical protein [Dehalococcoidia bacterium]
MTISLQFTQGESKTVTQKITIANEGEGVMTWAATKTASWLWMTEPTGALEKGYSKSLEVFIAPSGLEAGTYNDKITIEAVGTRNSPLQVEVTVLIKPVEATQQETDGGAVRKAVPAPPWEYSEYEDFNYHFRIRYPKDYRTKMIAGIAFGAVSNTGEQQSDTIMLGIVGSYGITYKELAMEWTKTAIHQLGGKPNPKNVSEEQITLEDGATTAYEMVYQSKSAATSSFQVYILAVPKGSRYIIFSGCAPLSYAEERLETWKQIGHTFEYVD